MKIGIIGMGYVGLVTSAVLANHGNHVVGVDIETEKITKLKNNSIPIFEPQLERVWLLNAQCNQIFHLY